MKKVNEKIVPMNVTSLTLDFVMDSNEKLTCIVKHPSGAIVDLVNDMDLLSGSIEEIVKLAVNQLSNINFPGNE